MSVELPTLRLIFHGIDFLELQSDQPSPSVLPINFQQDTYRVWYQIDGFGIIQNVTQNTFGSARPGLLGVMERGERHTYLHQRSHFSCFQLLFTILPSLHAKCFWNSAIEGKIILDPSDQSFFENTINKIFLVLCEKKAFFSLMMLPPLLEVATILLNKGLIIIEESRFPKDKSKSLVAKAKCFMDAHYTSLKHQDDLEKECGVDINYLNILFKKQTGKTLYDYLTGVRMEHAKYLLEATEYSISDVATRSGYPSLNSFCRAFKRKVSLTPQEYRYKQQNHATRK